MFVGRSIVETIPLSDPLYKVDDEELYEMERMGVVSVMSCWESLYCDEDVILEIEIEIDFSRLNGLLSFID